MTPAPVLSLLTDFGPGSVYVGEVHAVVRSLLPDAVVVDLAHDCPPGDVEAGAYLIGRAWSLCPPGTAHVVVVDPGVGTARRILAARARGHLFVGPDNGVLAPLVEGGEVRSVENDALFRRPTCATFHGRDVMAPVAARLLSGTPFAEVGPPASPRALEGGAVTKEDVVEGRVLLHDRFGNLVTNVPASAVLALGGVGRALRVRVGDACVEGISRTFGDVAQGAPLAYVGSGGHLEIAVNGGRASDLFPWPHAAVRVERMAP